MVSMVTIPSLKNSCLLPECFSELLIGMILQSGVVISFSGSDTACTPYASQNSGSTAMHLLPEVCKRAGISMESQQERKWLTKSKESLLCRHASTAAIA
jgi:hypothetical protein